MVTKAQKIRLGIFLAIGSLLLIIFIGAVVGSRLVEKRDYYYIVYEDYSVSGLQVGGAVNFSGIRVGRVETITIDPKNVMKIKLKISIQAGTPIKEDAEAALVAVGITGLKSVEIRGGTNSARTLKPGSFIKPGSSMLDDITGKAVSIAEKIDVIAANISSMTDEENRKNVAEILKQTSLLIAETRASLTATLQSISIISANAAKVSDNAGNNLDKITDNLTKNMDSLTVATTGSIYSLSNTMTKELTEISKNLNKSITDIDSQTTFLLADTRYQINAVGGHTDLMVLEATKQIAAISGNINQSLDRINAMINSPEFDKLMVNVNTLSAQLAEANLKNLVTELSSTVQKTGSLVSNMDRLLTRNKSNIMETLESLRETTENLNEFSKQISDNPSLLLRGY